MESVIRRIYDLHNFTTAQLKAQLISGIYSHSVYDGCTTSNDVRCRDMGSEESTREEVRCGELRMLRWMSGVTKPDRIRNERIRIRGTTKVGEISKKV